MIHYDRNGIIIRDADEKDVVTLGGRLRDEDEREVIAAGNKNGEDSLRQSFARSEMCYTVDLDGAPVGMFGIVRSSILGGDANVWFLGAKELAKMKRPFVKLSRHVIAYFLSQFPVLWNTVDARYVSSIRWLESCGAVFDQRPIMIGDFPFYTFVIRKGE